MKAGTIEIDMLANVANLITDMRAAKGAVTDAMEHIEKSVEGAKHALEALGIGLTIREFARFVGDAIEAADALTRLSQRTGIAVEDLSQLQFAAKIAQVPIDMLTVGMKKLQVSIAQGLAGDQTKIELFKQLGVTTADLGKGTLSVMMQMSDAYAHAQDGAGKTAVSIALMGKAGDEMIPLLNGGSRAIRDLMAEADKLGLTIGTEFAERAREFEDNLTRMHAGSQKLAIILAGDVVEGVGKAIQAFVDGAKEGNKFLAVIEAFRTLATGDDMHKANVTLVEDTDKLLAAENELTRLQGARAASLNGPMIEAQKTYITGLKDEIATTLKYRASLTAEADAAKAAADAIKAARENGKVLAVPAGGAGAAEEYERLNKEIQKYVELTQAELDFGRALPESMKKESEGLTNIADAWARGKITLQQAIALEDKLHNATVLKEALELRQKLTKAAQEEAAAMMQGQQEESDQALADSLARQSIALAITAQFAALKESNEQLDLERTLLGASDKERATSIASLQIEQRLRQQIFDIQHSKAYDNQSDRDVDIRNAQEAAAQARQQVQVKAGLQEQLTLIGDIESAGKSAWDAFFQSGTDRVKALSDILKHYLLDLIYQLEAKPIVLNIAANLVGSGGIGGVAGGGIGGLLGTANSANSAYSLYNTGVSGMANSGGIMGAFAQGYSGSAAIGTGSSFASTVGGGLATDAMGAGVAEGAAAAGIETGVGAGVTAGLAAIPVVGWVALAGMALYSIFGGQGGGPKSEAGFAPNGMNIAGLDIGGNMQGSQRGDVSAAQQLSTGISASYKALADQLGLVNDKLDVGLFYAQDPQGTSQTQLQVVGGTYNRSTQEGGIENVGRGDQALKDAIALATAQLILSNLQSSDLKGKVGDYIKAINPTGMTSDQINASLTLAANARTLYAAFEKLGPAFAYVNDMSVQAVNDLANAAGGMDKFSASLSSYYDNFYTDEEKRSAAAKQISDTLAQAGLQISADAVLAAANSNDARGKFRQLTEQMASMGADGQAAYLALLSVNGAFANLISTASSAASTVDAMATANTNAQITSDVAAAQEALNAARKAETTSVQATVTSLASATTNFRAFAGSLRDFRDSLLLGNLSPLTPGQKYAEARSQFESTYAAAQGGDPAAMAKLQDLSTAFLQASQVYNASSTAYQSDFAEVQSALTLSASKADAMATQGEAQLAILNAQLSSLETVNSSVLSVKDAIAALAVAVGAAIKAGVNPGATAVSSLTGGVTGKWVDTQVGQVWASAGGAASTGGSIYAINGQSYTIAQATDYINTLVTAGRLTDAYYAFKSAGISLSDADQLMHWAPMTAENWAKSQGLPVFHDGTDYVPRTGLALLQQGEAVISRSQNLGGGGELLAALIERVDNLANRVDYLTERNEQGTRALIGANYDAADKAASKVVDGTAGKQGRASWERRLQAEAAPS